MYIEKLKKAIEIFEKYLKLDEEYFQAEHDQIWIGELSKLEKITEGDKKELEELGFFKDEDFYSCFC